MSEQGFALTGYRYLARLLSSPDQWILGHEGRPHLGERGAPFTHPDGVLVWSSFEVFQDDRLFPWGRAVEPD